LEGQVTPQSIEGAFWLHKLFNIGCTNCSTLLHPFV